jgi:hypothetical protein
VRASCTVSRHVGRTVRRTPHGVGPSVSHRHSKQRARSRPVRVAWPARDPAEPRGPIVGHTGFHVDGTACLAWGRGEPINQPTIQPNGNKWVTCRAPDHTTPTGRSAWRQRSH